jgi:hypothetical protein
VRFHDVPSLPPITIAGRHLCLNSDKTAYLKVMDACGRMNAFIRILFAVRRINRLGSAYCYTESHFHYGSSLSISLGYRHARRTLSRPMSFIVSRSSPRPSPPCGGMPER